MNKPDTQKNVLLKTKEYEIIGLLDGDLKLIHYLEEVLSEWESDEYDIEDNEGISGMVSSIADGSVPIYPSEFWGNVSLLEPYIDEAISETSPWNMKSATLQEFIHEGHFNYYKELLYKNVETMFYNIMVKHVNCLLAKQSNETIHSIQSNLAAIEEELENAAYVLEREMYDAFDINVLYEVAEDIIESAITDLEEPHTSQ